VSLAFAADGKALYVADNAGRLTCLEGPGRTAWRVPLGSVSALAAAGRRVYAAGRDGRLRPYTADGKPRWVPLGGQQLTWLFNIPFWPTLRFAWRRAPKMSRPRASHTSSVGPKLMSVWRTCWQHGRSALEFLSQLLRGALVALALPP
jgi:hypothetical protein